MKKSILTLVASLLICCMMSTGVADTAHSVVIGETLDPESLTPYAALYADRYALLCMIYQPLVLTVDSDRYNVMCTGVDEVSTGVYDVHLYDNIYDTAGNHFTASDVVFSYGLAKESGNFSKLDAVTEVKALDDYTAEIVFDDTMMFGQIDTVLSQVFMVTEAAYKASGDNMAINAVGTTGYVVSNFTEGSNITFKKAENGYWQKAAQGEDGYVAYYDATKLDEVRYEFISESSQRAIALETATIDIADRISPADAQMFDGRNEIKVYEKTGEAYSLTYNCAENAPFSNENLRKAVAYSWDANGIIAGALDGAGEPLTALSNRYRLDYNNDLFSTWDYYGYNPEKAKEYLDKYLSETGKKASDVSITIMVANNEYLEKVAQVMQAYVLQLGIDCKMVSYDNVTRKSIRNSKEGWDIAIAKDTAISLYPVDGFAMQYNRDTGKSLAGGWIDDDELQARLLAAISLETHSVETVTAFEQYMYDHCYCLGVVIDTAYAASLSWVDMAYGPYGVVSACASNYNWEVK